jgi:hypothetical protein
MKNIFQKLILILSAILILIALTLCSREVNKYPRIQPDSYLSPKYEDESFKNVSMDICYPFIDFENVPPYTDSAHASMMKDFYDSFIKYFPQGIKTFSSVTQTSWIFFEPDYMGESIEYYTKTKDSLDFYVSLPDSLTNFQKKSNADFLIITQYASFSLMPPDSMNPKSKYSTSLDFEFCIWDRVTSDLVAVEKVNVKTEFDRLVNKWPYRSAMMKMASLFFEKLPMFEK